MASNMDEDVTNQLAHEFSQTKLNYQMQEAVQVCVK